MQSDGLRRLAATAALGLQPADDIVEWPPEPKPKTIAKLMYKYESAHTPCDTSKTIYT